MAKKYAIKLGIVFFAFMMIFGCVSVQRPDDMKAQIVNYQLPKLPDEGKAMVYVVRPSTYFGAVSLHVYVDSKERESEMGFTKGNQYICFNISPGEHLILSKGENWAEMKISAKAGDVIFIQQEPAMPIIKEARNKLRNLQDYEGKYYVKTLSQNRNIADHETYGSKYNVASATSAPVSATPSENQNILGITVGPTDGVRGVRVLTVIPGSPCENLLKPGDKIFTIDLFNQDGSKAGGGKVNAENFKAEVSKIQPGMTVKLLLDPRIFSSVSCIIPATLSNAPMGETPSGKNDFFIGTVTGGNFAKGVGFSNINIKLEVTADNGVKEIFFVRSDSKVIDAGGNQIEYIKAHGIKGKKIAIEYFTITDATGGDPTRSDFTFEIGQKGVRILHLLD